MHAVSSAYYGLNATATYIWESLVHEPLSGDDVAGRVASRFGVAENAVRDDVDAFLRQLEAEGLVCESDGAANGNGTAASALPPTSGEFTPPRMSRFGELEQLVLSGE